MKLIVRFIGTMLFLIQFLSSYSSMANEKTDSLLANKYANIADSLFKINSYDSAVIYYGKASAIFRTIKDWNNINRCEVWKSYVYIDMGKYDNARTNLDEAIIFFNQNLGNNNLFSFNCSTKKSAIYFSQGKYIESKNNLTQSLKIVSTNPEFSSPKGQKIYASACFEFGNNYIEMGQLDSAIVMYKKTLELREGLYEKNHDLIVDCYNNLGIVYSYYGDYEIAISYMQKALKSREEAKGFAHTLTAWSYTNLGIVHININRFDRALEYALKGLESRKLCLPPNHIEFGSSYSVIANIYNETGKYEEALKYHFMALDIFIDKLGEKSNQVSSIYNNIADNYNKQHEYKKALSYFHKSLKMLNESSPEVITPSHILYEYNIADTYLNLGNVDSALVFNTLALKSNFGPVLENQNINAILDFYYAFCALEQKAAIFMKRFKSTAKIEDLRTANDAYLKYIELLDYLRIKSNEADSKLTLSNLNSSIMNDVINTSFLLGRLNPNSFPDAKLAFLIEKNKANVLQEMLDKTNNNQKLAMPDSLTKKWKEISGLLIAQKAEQLFLNDKDDEKLQKNNERVFQLQDQLYKLNDYIQKNYPNRDNCIDENRTFNNLALKQDSLTAILDYFVSDTLLYICIIDSKQIQIKTTPIDSTFKSTVEEYIRCIKKNRVSDFDRLSEHLYSYLIKPIETLIKGKRKLVIIPDKFLFYIPFETLCSDKLNQDFRTKSYLIKRYDILYHYSATFYCENLPKYFSVARTKPSFVGFAPVFDGNGMSQKVSTQCLASISDTLIHDNQEIQRSISYDGISYNGLPFSKQEVNQITKMFEKHNFRAENYLNSNASEDNFKRVCPNFSIIHLASHGFINENKPNQSGIIFYPDTKLKDTVTAKNTTEANSFAENGSSTNGILTTGEMYNLNLNADLVVLSTCETGLGSIIKGEGIMSMARGFIYSGAPNILFSLWKIGDKNTCTLMVEFYAHLLTGDSYSSALRKSKLKMILDENTAFPKFWSGITLLGIN